LQNGKKVALKEVKKKNMRPKDIYQQKREIEIIKLCNHKYIIKMIDFYENQDTYYIVLEFLEGNNLFQYVKSRDLIVTEERSKFIAWNILQGNKIPSWFWNYT
jgi:serine/threonine protein kinase